MVKEKYSLDDWNKGYSPKGNLLINNRFSFGELSISAQIENGVMQNCTIYGDFFSKKDIKEVCDMLNGKPFEKQTFVNALSIVDQYISGATAKEIIDFAYPND